jgi:D-alanyl-D-alanine carboxypeptidase
LASQVNQASGDNPFPSKLATQMQGALDTWALAPEHRGVSAAVTLSAGQEWFGSAGIEGTGEELLSEHLIWIASITKTMTGAVILGLAEEGLLNLDDAISLWLEDLAYVDPEISIRQLLNHTNGLANYTRNPGLGPAIGADPTRLFSARELVEFVGPMSFERGQRTEYTNTAFVLLGLIAESVTGASILELYHERLWKPLGLNEIFLPGFESPPGPVARAWAGPGAEQATAPLERISLLSIGNSAFGLFATAQTVARWGRALFTGKVFGESMRQQMLEFVPAAGNIRGESGAGLGIRGYNYLQREQWGHSGGSPLGSSLMLFDPETGTTVVVLMNQGGGAQHFTLAPELLRIATD